MSGRVNVAALQMHCEENPQRNLENARDRISNAASAGATLICLPEMFSMRYPCQKEDHRQFDLAESIPDGPTYRSISKLARDLNVVIVTPLFERRAPGVYHNTIVIFEADGSEVGRYRKMHIPDDPNYYEKFYFTPGDLGFQNISTSVAEIGPLVCWDQWFPEAARITALKGAQVLIYPTAIGWIHGEKEEFGASQLDAWQTMMRSHAIANGVFVIAPNRVGVEDEIEFWGNSFICDPNGNLSAQASDSDDETVIAECNLDQIDLVRTHWPFLRDRRIDAYDEILQRYID
ncbi:carbon-nitrogen hydrolase [Planctomycetota bacterium]